MLNSPRYIALGALSDIPEMNVRKTRRGEILSDVFVFQFIIIMIIYRRHKLVSELAKLRVPIFRRTYRVHIEFGCKPTYHIVWYFN